MLVHYKNMDVHCSIGQLYVEYYTILSGTLLLSTADATNEGSPHLMYSSYSYYVIVIAQGQGFMAVNGPESEGEA